MEHNCPAHGKETCINESKYSDLHGCTVDPDSTVLWSESRVGK
jgi:hypothetical protein